MTLKFDILQVSFFLLAEENYNCYNLKTVQKPANLKVLNWLVIYVTLSRTEKNREVSSNQI